MSVEPERLHPLTGVVRRPWSGSENKLEPLVEDFAGSELTVEGLQQQLDDEVAAIAAKQDAGKKWKETFRDDKQAIALKLEQMGMGVSKKPKANYRTLEKEREGREKQKFLEEKEAMRQRLMSLGGGQRPGSARSLVRRRIQGELARTERENGRSPAQSKPAADSIVGTPAATAAPAAASPPAVSPATAAGSEGTTESVLDAGRNAREEWEAAKLRVKKLEGELEQGRLARAKIETNSPKRANSFRIESPSPSADDLMSIYAQQAESKRPPEAPASIAPKMSVQPERGGYAAAAAAAPAEPAARPGGVAQEPATLRSMLKHGAVPLAPLAAPTDPLQSAYMDDFMQEFEREKSKNAQAAQARRQAAMGGAQAAGVAEGAAPGETDMGAQGAHLNPLGLFLNFLGLFLRTCIPFVWRILSAFLPA